jgi:hypothetical protein
MGADLYINPLYQPQLQKWEPKFEKAARLRDSLKPGTEEHRPGAGKRGEVLRKDV